MWQIGINGSVAPFLWLFLSSVVVPFFGQLKTEDWLSAGAEIRTLVVQAKWYNVHVCSVAKKCFPYPYWMWLRSWFESSSSCTGTWEESEQKWLKWPLGGVSNIGWCSLPCLLLLVAVIPQLLGQWTWISVLSPHLLQNSKPSPPLPLLTADISTEHRDQLSSNKRWLTMGEACRWVLQGMPPVFVPHLSMVLKSPKRTGLMVCCY